MYNVFDRGPRRLFVDHNTGTVGTGVLVSGSVAKVSGAFTIPTTGGVSLSVNPSTFLDNGFSDYVLIQGVLGALSKASGVYTFTPSSTRTSPVAVPTGATIYPYQTERPNNPTEIGLSKLEEKNKNLYIDSDFGREFAYLLSAISKMSGYEFALVDGGVVPFGVRDDGVTEIAALEIPETLSVSQNIFKDGYLWLLHDIVSKIIPFGVRDDGVTEIAALEIPEALTAFYNQFLKDQFAIYSQESKEIALSIKDGKTSINRLIDKNLGVTSTTADGSTVFFSKLVDDESQIFSLVIATNALKQLTWVGNNTSPQFNATTNKLYFVSDRTGQSEPYDMDLDGTNQSRIVNRAEVLQIYRHGIEITGQSNSVNADGQPIIDTTQPYNNTKLSDSSGNYLTVGGTLSYAPLVEPVRPVVGSYYPQNIAGGGLATALGNVISGYMGASFRCHLMQVGRGGASLSEISDAGDPAGTYPGGSWAAGLFEANALKYLATNESRTYDVGCVVMVNGETDAGAGTVDFAKKLVEWLKKYNFTRKAITGQKRDIPLVIFQQHTFSQSGGGYPPVVTEEQFIAPKIDPLIFNAGPRYQYDNVPEGPSANPSGVHHSGYGHRALGIKAGQIVKAVYVDGWWRPLEPISAKQIGNIIRIKFSRGGLNFDPNITQPTNIINSANPWINAKGFEAYDALGGFVGLIAARVSSSTEIDLETSLADAGKVAVIRYAQSCAANASVTWSGAVHPANREQGRRGALRDSDPFIGPDLVTVNCNVTNGSANITSVAANGFLGKAGKYYMAIAASLATDTIVSTRTSDSALVLSQQWTGATGTANIQFRSEQRNYCVAFKIPVPYQE